MSYTQNKMEKKMNLTEEQILQLSRKEAISYLVDKLKFASNEELWEMVKKQVSQFRRIEETQPCEETLDKRQYMILKSNSLERPLNIFTDWV